MATLQIAEQKEAGPVNRIGHLLPAPPAAPAPISAPSQPRLAGGTFRHGVLGGLLMLPALMLVFSAFTPVMFIGLILLFLGLSPLLLFALGMLASLEAGAMLR